MSNNTLIRQKYCNTLFFNTILHKSRILATFDNMRIVSHRNLRDFFLSPGNEDAKVPLERWYEIAEKADWKNYADIKTDFQSVDYVGNQHYVFNISGNKFRLVVVVKFIMGYVFVRWVGRHKDYDSIDCKNI